MLQDQETMPVLVRRFDDPPKADFTFKRRHSLETLWQAKFNELAERDFALSSMLAHVETNTTSAQVELQEKLTTIIDSLTQLNHMSNKVEQLQQEVNTKRKEDHEIKANETRLEALISRLEEKIVNFEEKIVSLESANQYLRRERALFDAIVAALIILAAFVFYHVFFGETK